MSDAAIATKRERRPTPPSAIFFSPHERLGDLKKARDQINRRLRQTGDDDRPIATYEDIHKAGQLLIPAILQRLNGAKLAIFEISHFNLNVQFEVGFALGAGKPIWLLVLKGMAPEFCHYASNPLCELPYTEYANADDIEAAFFDPAVDPLTNEPVEVAKPPGSTARSARLLSIVPPHDYGTERALRGHLNALLGTSHHTTQIQRHGMEPFHQLVAPVLRAKAVVGHMCATIADGQLRYDARIALMAGVAVGRRLPMLLLADKDWPPPDAHVPADLKAYVQLFSDADHCLEIVDAWLLHNGFGGGGGGGGGAAGGAQLIDQLIPRDEINHAVTGSIPPIPVEPTEEIATEAARNTDSQAISRKVLANLLDAHGDRGVSGKQLRDVIDLATRPNVLRPILKQDFVEWMREQNHLTLSWDDKYYLTDVGRSLASGPD